MWFVLFLVLFSPFISAEFDMKPVLQDILVPKNLSENITARLFCSIKKGKNLKFDWYLNNDKLETNDERRIVSHEESSELVIKSLSINDIGEIKCICKNQYGEDVQKAFLLFNGNKSQIFNF